MEGTQEWGGSERGDLGGSIKYGLNGAAGLRKTEVKEVGLRGSHMESSEPNSEGSQQL